MNIVIRKLFSCYCIIKSDFLLISKSQSIFEYILELEDKTTDYNIKTDLVIFLLEQLDIVHEDIKFLFHSICRYCRIEVIKWCIEKYPHIHNQLSSQLICNDHGQSCLLVSIFNPYVSLDMFKLISHGLKFHQVMLKDKHGTNVLIASCIFNNVDFL